MPGDDSITVQSHFATILYKLFPDLVPDNSLAGQSALGQGVATRQFQAAREIIRNPVARPLEKALDLLENDDEIRQAALEEFINAL